MTIGVPGSKGLFSLLQTGFVYKDKGWIRITPSMCEHIKDFEYLAKSLCKHVTSISEIVLDIPAALGPVDSIAMGMEGAWLPTTTES